MLNPVAIATAQTLSKPSLFRRICTCHLPPPYSARLRTAAAGALAAPFPPGRSPNAASPLGKQRERAPVSVRPSRQPLVTTGVGYLPIGALPTGYLPIGALPTGGAGGGGSLRGRSAAAAALSMAKDAAVASTTIFIMTIPLVSGQHRLSEARRRDNRRGTPPSSHHHLARAVSTAARLTML